MTPGHWLASDKETVHGTNISIVCQRWAQRNSAGGNRSSQASSSNSSSCLLKADVHWPVGSRWPKRSQAILQAMVLPILQSLYILLLFGDCCGSVVSLMMDVLAAYLEGQWRQKVGPGCLPGQIGTAAELRRGWPCSCPPQPCVPSWMPAAGPLPACPPPSARCSCLAQFEPICCSLYQQLE